MNWLDDITEMCLKIMLSTLCLAFTAFAAILIWVLFREVILK